MAFRSSASATGTGTGTITATPAGVQAHDYLGGWWLADGSATPTLTPPVGWTQRASVHVTIDGSTQFYADKNDATGSDAFGFADDAVGNDKALITAAWSGRNNSAPRSATPVTTGNSVSNTSPISATITGITAVNGDDIGIGLGSDEDTAGARWTESTIASYTQQVNGVALDWVSGAGLQTRDNVSAGATGNFAVTITRTAGLGNSGYCGIVVAIAAAAASSSGSAGASVAARPGGSMGPRMRRALPQLYPDSPVTPTELTQSPAAPIKAMGPRRRRSIPQQYADTPAIQVELTQSPAAPFRPGRGPGKGPMLLRRNLAWPLPGIPTANPDVTVALTGVQGTGSVGTLGVQLDVALTGNAATGSVGTLTPGTALALTGVSGTGSVGTLAPSTDAALTGVAGTGAVGTLAPTNTVTLAGNEATVTIGTLTPDVAGDVTIALTGVSATASVGDLSPSGADVPVADTGAGRGSDDAPRRRRRYIFPDGTQVLATPNEALGLLEQFARMRKPETGQQTDKGRPRRQTFVRIPPAELESIVQWKRAADTAEELIQPVLSLNVVFTPDPKQFAQAIARLKRKIDDEEAIFALMM